MVRAPHVSRWLNATVLGFALTSLLSDVSHEMATAVLPMYLGTLGLGALALGVVEGVSDLVNGLAKLVSGVAGQRIERKKAVAAACYAVTALGTSAMGLVASLPALLGMRSLAWAGRGFRGPLRDFLMADAVETTHYGRAFGLERAGDMIGAVLGPLLAIVFLTAGVVFREMLLIALVPGLAAAACVMFLVRERRFRAEGEVRTLRGMHGALPRSFRPLVAAILVFGIGDFSRSFLILAAAKASGAVGDVGLGRFAVAMPVVMYAVHNLISAVATFPAGRASDSLGRRRVLAVGYGLGLTCNVLLAVGHGSLALVAGAIVISGIYIAIEETAEKSLVAELLPRGIRSYGLGILAAANAAGDMISSLGVGLLWEHIGATQAFAAAAIFSALGLLMLMVWRRDDREDRAAVSVAGVSDASSDSGLRSEG